MKVHPQTIFNGQQPEFIVLPVKEYNKIINALEEFQDVQEIRDYLDKGGETFPMEVVLALSKGENPIKVYREYRGFSQSALAQKSDISKQYISQLENSERVGTTRVLRTIAKALKVDIDDIAN